MRLQLSGRKTIPSVCFLVGSFVLHCYEREPNCQHVSVVPPSATCATDLEQYNSIPNETDALVQYTLNEEELCVRDTRLGLAKLQRTRE